MDRMRNATLVILALSLMLLGGCTAGDEPATTEEPTALTPEPLPTPTLTPEPEAAPEPESEPAPETPSETDAETEPETETETVPMAPAVGHRFPDFQIQTPDGKTSWMSDYNSPLVLNFWHTRCSPCTTEMPILEEIYNDYKEAGLILIAVNIGESRDTIVEFIEDEKVEIPWISSYALYQQYLVQYLPTTFFIDSKSIIQDIKVGAFRSRNDLENHLKTIMPSQP